MSETRLARNQEGLPDQERVSEERYRKLVELSPNGITVHREGRFEYINPAGARILGASRGEDLLGRQVLEFIHSDYHQVFAERLALLEEHGVELPWMEERLLRCGGGEVVVEVTALPFILDGKPAFQSIFRDITERKAAGLRLERMANYDVLTALPNRSLFLDRLNQLILHARRDAARFALLCIDLDCFKVVNERLGDYFGDLLLKEVALRLTSCLRETDTVARTVGDRFVVLLSRIFTRADAASMAERITHVIGMPFTLQDRECSLSASIGISLFPEDGETSELQLAKADTAMHRCKMLPGTPYQFHSPESAGAQGGARLTRSASPATGRTLPDGDLAEALAS